MKLNENALTAELETLCALDGTSGDEGAVRDYIIKKLDSMTGVSYTVDPAGNVIAKKAGAEPKNKVMLIAHTDEVGFIVTDITDEGYLHFAPVGGISAAVVFGRQVRFKNGTVGVIGGKPIHQLTGDEKDAQPKLDSLLIDIGATDKADAEKYVSRGDCCCFVSEFFRFGDNCIKGKAIDDRAGCAILLALLGDTAGGNSAFTCVFSTMEEIGTRGATCAAYNVKPDMCITLETTTACDIYGEEGAKKVCVTGGGTVISYMDRSTAYDRGLYALANETAEECGIPAQTKTMIAGGNDSGAVHKAVGGVRTIALSVPCRYLHSPACVIKESDYIATAQLAAALLGKLAAL